MTTFKINIQNSTIQDLEQVTFDAEFSTSIRGESQITGYPVEDGFLISNGMINKPEIFRARLGMGVRKLTGLLSDPIENLQQNWTSYITGMLSNYVDSGIASYLGARYAQVLANSLIQPTSRQGQLYITLQSLRLTGADVNLVVHGIGQLNNFNIKTVELSRQDRDDIAIDVTFQQRIGKGGNTRTITTASGTTDLGNVSTKEQIDGVY